MTRLKNTALIAVTIIAAMGFILGACTLDADSWVPYVLCVVCGTWLVLFGLANGGMDQ